VLRFESPSGICAKLRTVASSNNRVHTTRSFYYCLFSPHIRICCCSSRTFRSWWTAHSAQRQRWGCNNIASFLQRTALIARSFREDFTQYDLHILVTAPFCCDRNARTACAQSFPLWQQATIEFTQRDHFIIACSRHIYMVLLLAHIPFVVNHAFSATPTEWLQQ